MNKSAAGALEDFLLNYNVGGIHLPRAAFDKMQDEISLEEFTDGIADAVGFGARCGCSADWFR